MSLADIRREYLGQPLSETDSDADPFAQFARWFAQVRETRARSDAMALATATRDGRPSVRNVLLKGVDESRLRVLHQLQQPQGARARARPAAPACCSTGARSSGRCASTAASRRCSAAESDAYFATRPIESRWSVYASNQSEVIDSREALELRFNAARERFDERRPAAGVVGRVSRDPGRVRVLAGTSEPAARSAALCARGEWLVAPRSSRALTTPLGSTDIYVNVSRESDIYVVQHSARISAMSKIARLDRGVDVP